MAIILKTLAVLIVLSVLKAEPPKVSCDDCAQIFSDKKYTCYRKKELGTGSSGIAFLVQNSEGLAVIKAQNVANDYELTKAKREAKLLMSFNNPYVIKMYKYVTEKGIWYSLLEYASQGAMDEFMWDKKEYFADPVKCLTFFKKLCEGFQYLHKSGYIHGDHKPGNTAIDEYDNPKIIDFDMARKVNEKVTWFAGTPPFMDPRVLGQTLTFWDAETDIYSLGVTLYQMAHGCSLPYTGSREDPSVLKKSVEKGTYSIKENTEYFVAKIIEGMLRKDHTKRLTLAQVITFCNSFLDNNLSQPIKAMTINANTETKNELFVIKSKNPRSQTSGNNQRQDVPAYGQSPYNNPYNNLAGGQKKPANEINGGKYQNNFGGGYGDQNKKEAPREESEQIIIFDPQSEQQSEQMIIIEPEEQKEESQIIIVEDDPMYKDINNVGGQNAKLNGRNDKFIEQEKQTPKKNVQENKYMDKVIVTPKQPQNNQTPGGQNYLGQVRNYANDYKANVVNNGAKPQQNQKPVNFVKGYRRRLFLKRLKSVASVSTFEWVVFVLSLFFIFSGLVALLRWKVAAQVGEPSAKLNPIVAALEVQGEPNVGSHQILIPKI